MRITKIEISGFGKFIRKTFDFSDNLTIFEENNGYGKSTLADFIRVMFYGFKNENGKIVERERNIRKPWGDYEVYGGRIWFEANDKKYVLTRTFATDRNSNDTFSVKYDGALLRDCEEFTADNIGKILFGVDAASFDRTCYISQKNRGYDNLDEGVNDDIGIKLGRLTDNTENKNSYTDIKKKLHDAKNAMSFTRATGKGKKLKEELAVLNKDIMKAELIYKELENNNSIIEDEKSKRAQNEAELLQLNIELKNAANAGQLRKTKEYYQKLLDEKNEALAEKEKSIKSLPALVPTDDELDECNRLITDREVARNSYRENALTDDEKRLLEEGSRLFSMVIPEADEVDSYIKKCQSMDSKEDEINKLSVSEEDSRRLSMLSSRYEGLDIYEDIKKCLSATNEKNLLKEEIYKKENSLESAAYALEEQKKENRQKAGNTLLMYMVIAVVLAILAVAIIAFGYSKLVFLGVGIALLAVAIVLFIVGFLAKKNILNRTFSSIQAEMEKLEEEVLTRKVKLQDIEDREKKICERLNIPYSPKDVFSVFFSVEREMDEYMKLKAKDARCRNNPLIFEYDNLKKEIGDYIRRYYPDCIEGGYRDNLHKLKGLAGEYRRIVKKQHNETEAEENNNNINARLQQLCNAFEIPFDEDIEDSLDKLKERILALRQSEKFLIKKTQEYDAFVNANDMDELLNFKDVEYRSTDDINLQIESLREQIDNSNRIIMELNASNDSNFLRIEEIEEKKDKALVLDEKITEMKDNIECLKKFEDFLDKAKDNLTDRYIMPVKNGFEKYLYDILPDGEKFFIDENISVQADLAGQYRKVVHFSKGYRDLLDVVLRMGLIDVMYEREKPVLIFDDPFVNLDDEKMGKAMKMLENIADNEGYQIIYFTCSRRGLNR